MTKKAKKQTSAARATLAVRQSTRQAEKKRGLEPAEGSPVQPSGKRIRSGTITAVKVSTSTVAQPDNPEPTRPRPCPKMRIPEPEVEPQGEIHSPIELPPNSKLIIMSNRSEVGMELDTPKSAEANPTTQTAKENLLEPSEELTTPLESAEEVPSSDAIVLDESSKVELIDCLDVEGIESEKTTVSIKAEKVLPGQATNYDAKPVKPSKTTVPKEEGRTTGSTATSKAWKAQAIHAVHQQSEDEEDAWNRDGDGDDDGRGEKVSGGKKIDNSKLLIEFEVPRFNAFRMLKLRPDTNYYEFRHKIGQIIESLETCQIGYWAGKKKDLKGKPTPRVLENRHDYTEMVNTAVEAITAERDRYEKESRVLEEATKEAKGKRGAPSRKKVAPVEDYVIRLLVTPIDDGVSRKSKKSTGSKDKKSLGGTGKPALDEEDETNLKTEASKQLAWLEKLKAKHFCATHKRHCARLPGEQGQHGQHVQLDQGDFLLWSDMLANNREDVTIFKAPKVLRLHEHKGDEVTDSGEVRPNTVTPMTPSQAPVQPAPPPHQYPPPPFFPGWPPYYPPPPGTPGYPPHSYPMPPPPTIHAQPLNDPLVSEWLAQCDAHATRGADGHQFATLLPQFSTCQITRISDIARFSSPDQLRDAISEHSPKIPYGTAAWLLEYAKLDYQ